MDQSRISHLAMPERLTGKSVVIVGLGSVGFPVMTHLVMAGVEHLVLVDPDVYDEPNLVKHPGRRTDIGRSKVEMAKDWVLDRHPTAQVVAHQNDALHPEFRDVFESALEHASVVVIVTDSKLSRVELARWCAKKSVPAVIGTVFRSGFGGDAFLQHTPHTGCYDCLLAVAQQIDVGRSVSRSLSAPEVELERRDKQYGLDPDPSFGLSGLSTDISFVANLVARVALAVLFDAFYTPEYLTGLTKRTSALTRLESHMLERPFDARGGRRPEGSQPEVWYDPAVDEFHGFQAVCKTCGSEVSPGHDRFCSWCGAAVNITPSEGWFSLGKPDRIGDNLFTMFTRNHSSADDPDDTTASGRVRIVFPPFTIQQRHIARSPDCRTCLESNKSGGVQ